MIRLCPVVGGPATTERRPSIGRRGAAVRNSRLGTAREPDGSPVKTFTGFSRSILEPPGHVVDPSLEVTHPMFDLGSEFEGRRDRWLGRFVGHHVPVKEVRSSYRRTGRGQPGALQWVYVSTT